MTTLLPMSACIFELSLPELLSIAPMERYVLGVSLLAGRGALHPRPSNANQLKRVPKQGDGGGVWEYNG